MFSKFLQSHSNFSLVLFIVIGIALWAKAFINVVPMVQPVSVSPLYNQLYNYVGGSAILCGFLALILIFLEAWLINEVLSENDLIPRNTYIGAYVFIILSGFYSGFIVLHPVLVANLFIILAIHLFLRLYEEQQAYPLVFNSGLLISIASMFYIPAALFLILLWLGFIIFRVFAWREWIISILGFALPYLFLGSWYFLTNVFIIKLTTYHSIFEKIDFSAFFTNTNIYLLLAIPLLLLLTSLFGVIGMINEKAIRIRKYMSFLIWFFILSLATPCIGGGMSKYGFAMIQFTAAVIFTIYLSHSKNSFMRETIIIVLLLLIITMRIGLWNSFLST